MPDDYPRPTWDQDAVQPNLDAWDDLLQETDLDIEPGRAQNITRPRGPSFAQYARKRGFKVPSYKGVRLDEEIEDINRSQMSEMIGLARQDERLMKRILRAHLHFGNKKVPECYLIFNMTPALQCPSLVFPRGHDFRTADAIPDASMCQAFDKKGNLVCYAIHAGELAYKDCFPYRVRQNQLWNELLIDEPELLIEVVTDIHRQYRDSVPIVAFRWSEAGDLESQKHLEAVYEVSRALAKLWAPNRIVTELLKDHEIPGTGEMNAKGKWIKGSGKIVRAGEYEFPWPGKFISYLYSARQDLDFSEAKRNKLVVLGSDWTGPGLSGQFVMVGDPSEGPRARGNQWQMCPMKCRICQRCPKGLNSKVLNH